MRIVVRSSAHDLHISETEDEDNGEYECMGRNEHGTVYSRSVNVYIRGTYPAVTVYYATIGMLQ